MTNTPIPVKLLIFDALYVLQVLHALKPQTRPTQGFERLRPRLSPHTGLEHAGFMAPVIDDCQGSGCRSFASNTMQNRQLHQRLSMITAACTLLVYWDQGHFDERKPELLRSPALSLNPRP